jgi:hypothetical protein
MDADPIAALFRNRVSKCHEEVGHIFKKHVRVKGPRGVAGGHSAHDAADRE